jgi:NAD(P)-dependent dehydrogenase (short-subunit alcohol dehydrogenase family)
MTGARVDAWRLADIPDQAGRTVLVTGTTLGGLGHHAALELARRGARVVLAGRNAERLGETRETIRAEVPAAELEQLEVDLADLESVRRAGETATAFGPIDVLVNNAGVMGTSRQVTADGLDLQLATNHFGPFLLTGLLLPQLLASKDATVVTVSSNMHRVARGAPLGDPRVHHGRYAKWRVYGQSKLANLLFTSELQRRLSEAGSTVRATAAHPGYAATNLQGHTGNFLQHALMGVANRVIAQSDEMGALPTLYAATQDLPGDSYVGPDGFQEQRGHPTLVGRNGAAQDGETARKLWNLSEELTGVAFPLTPAAA